MIIKLKNKDTLILDDFIFKCSIGKKGLKLKKKEGDLSTPKGIFKIKKLYYRSDREKQIDTSIPKFIIKKNMGWCDDPKSKSYNSLVNINSKFRYEKMYRKDKKYDMVLIIDYNLIKPIPYKGSAIFLHLTKNYNPTEGCIAINRNDMLILLKMINKNTRIKID